MLFVYPMWDSENERLGVQACSRSASILRGIAELFGALSFYLLVCIILFILYKLSANEYTNELLYFILIPFFIGILCEILFHIAIKKLSNVSYDFNSSSGITTWIENGERKSYIYYTKEKKIV